MKNSLTFLLILLSLVSCKPGIDKPLNPDEMKGKLTADTSEMTNNFYDNTETISLPMADLTVEGETANPGKVDFTGLPIHSVIVKETLLDSSGSDRFVGAYRYDGYSLFDILERRVIKKSNESEFKPVIDLFVEIENSIGQKVVFSWGEIYYPVNLHKIIIASSVSRIVPSKTKDLWPLPAQSKLVAANDLVTERNISSPVRIIIRSFPRSFIVNRELTPMYSDNIRIFKSGDHIGTISSQPGDLEEITYNTVFYGRGRGIHSTSPFSGIILKDLLVDFFPFNRTSIQSAIICFAGIDGYRCSVSYSELFNRNDQQEFLLVKAKEGEEGGFYRIFPACDFFSDRAVKSLGEIYME